MRNFYVILFFLGLGVCSFGQSYSVYMNTVFDSEKIISQQTEHFQNSGKGDRKDIEKVKVKTKKMMKDMKLCMVLELTPEFCSLRLNKKESKMKLKLGFISINMLKFMPDINIYYDEGADRTFYKDDEDKDEVAQDEFMGQRYCMMDIPSVYILGHECRAALSADSTTTVWFAPDIPVSTGAFKCISGLVLGIDKKEGMNMRATKIIGN